MSVGMPTMSISFDNSSPWTGEMLRFECNWSLESTIISRAGGIMLNFLNKVTDMDIREVVSGCHFEEMMQENV
jgi:hypothetical protein